VAELADALDSKSDETPSYRIVAIVHVRTSATENDQKRRSESQYLVNNVALKGIRIRASALRVLSLFFRYFSRLLAPHRIALESPMTGAW